MLSRRITLSSANTLINRRAVPSSSIGVLSSSLRFASNNNNKSNNEDAEEAAREQRLREMFQNKNQQPQGNGGFFDQLKQVHYQAKAFAEQKAAERVGQQQQGGNNINQQNQNQSSSSSSNNDSGNQQKPQVPSWFGPSQTFWTMMIYLTASYSLFLVWQLSDEQSFVSLTQGVPHWANGAYEESAYMLFRIIYSFRDQRRIQQEFEAVAPMAPNSSFLEFLNQRYAHALSGNTCSFAECVALMSSALRQDFGRNTAVIAQAAKSGSDAREKIDNIANALRNAGFRPMYSGQQQQQQQYYGGQQQQQFNQQYQYQQQNPYSAPIPPQLLQQAQGMHPVGFSGYGNPQMMQAWQQHVYNPHYAQQQHQQNQNQQQQNQSSEQQQQKTEETPAATATPTESKQ